MIFFNRAVIFPIVWYMGHHSKSHSMLSTMNHRAVGWMLFSILLALLVLSCLLLVATALPFNAAAQPGAWHYNGDVGRKPNLAIAEHVWPGLVKKELTFGGK